MRMFDLLLFRDRDIPFHHQDLKLCIFPLNKLLLYFGVLLHAHYLKNQKQYFQKLSESQIEIEDFYFLQTVLRK